MFISNDKIGRRILLSLIFALAVAGIAASVLYFTDIRALNTPPSYKGIFI